MFKEDLIKKIVGTQIYFPCDGNFAATLKEGKPVLMTNPQMWDSGYGNDYPDGIVPLEDLDFEVLEHLAKYQSWPVDEPEMYGQA